MKLPLAALLAAACAGSSPTLVDELAGEYKQTKVVEMVVQPPETVEDELTIVKASPTTAFFEGTLHFYNGHMCNVIGVAEVSGDALVYRDPELRDDGRQCVLEIRRVGDQIVFRDENAACEISSCGARGHFADVTLLISSRRPVADADERLDGYSYELALQEYQRLKTEQDN